MLKEFLETVSSQAVKAAGQQHIHPKEEPGHVYFLDGKKHVAEPAPRKHVAFDLSAIIEFAQANAGASVWYDRDAVVCLIDDATRRDRVTLSLAMSDQLDEIHGWERGKAFSQRELIFLLRTMFARNMARCPNLLAALRKVNVTNNAGGSSEIKPGKVSVSRSVEHEVSGAASLPEHFELDVPVFDGVFPSVGGTVAIALELDAASPSPFTLIPFPGDLERVWRAAEEWIGDQLRDLPDGVVHYGAVGD